MWFGNESDPVEMLDDKEFLDDDTSDSGLGDMDLSIFELERNPIDDLESMIYTEHKEGIEAVLGVIEEEPEQSPQQEENEIQGDQNMINFRSQDYIRDPAMPENIFDDGLPLSGFTNKSNLNATHLQSGLWEEFSSAKAPTTSFSPLQQTSNPSLSGKVHTSEPSGLDQELLAWVRFKQVYDRVPFTGPEVTITTSVDESIEEGSLSKETSEPSPLDKDRKWLNRFKQYFDRVHFTGPEVAMTTSVDESIEEGSLSKETCEPSPLDKDRRRARIRQIFDRAHFTGPEVTITTSVDESIEGSLSKETLTSTVSSQNKIACSRNLKLFLDERPGAFFNRVLYQDLFHPPIDMDDIEELTGVPRWKYENGKDSSYMTIINPDDVLPPSQTSVRNKSNKSPLQLDHCYSANSSPVPSANSSPTHHLQDSAHHFPQSEPISRFWSKLSDVEESTVQESFAPINATFRFRMPVSLPVKPAKRRGRPPRNTGKTIEEPSPRTVTSRKRSASSIIGSQAKKSKVQTEPSISKSRNTSTSSRSKKMSDDKREQHNAAERRRRQDTKTNLLNLEDHIPEKTLEKTQAALSYVKKYLEDKENLTWKVMNRLENMTLHKIPAKDFIKRKKGTRFPKVVILQSALYYCKELDNKIRKVEDEISRYKDGLNLTNHSVCNLNIERLKVQTTSPNSKPSSSRRHSKRL